jgi:hypothetical protein
MSAFVFRRGFEGGGEPSASPAGRSARPQVTRTFGYEASKLRRSMRVDRKTVVSAVISLPAAAAIALWVVSFCVPSLLNRNDLIPVYQAVLLPSLIAPFAAVVWRWQSGSSWHANLSLLVGVVAQGFNCCGFLYCLGSAAGSVG